MLYSRIILSCPTGSMLSTSNQPSRSTLDGVPGSGEVGVYAGDVSEPSYPVSELQPFFDVWTAASANVAAVSSASRQVRTQNSHLARETIPTTV